MSIFWALRKFFRAHWRSYCIAGILLVGVAVLNLIPPAVIGRVVDGIVDGSMDQRSLLLHALVLAGCAVGVYVLRIFWRQILYGASYTLSRGLRQEIYAHLLTLSPESMRAFSTGDLMARATNDVQAVEMTAGEAVLSIFDGLLTGILVLAVMVFTLSGWLTLMALAPWPLMSWAMWRLGEQLHRRFDVAQAAFSHLNNITQESIAGLRALRGLGAEAHAAAALAQASNTANDANLEVARIDSRYDPIIYLTVGASFAISVGGGAWLISLERLTIGELTSFTLYLGHLVWPMFAFGWVANMVQRGKAAWERIDAFFRTPSAVIDRGSKSSVDDHLLEVEVREFSYGGRAQPVLRDLHLRLEPGHTVGVVGPTGAGKSTLLGLIARFYEGPGVALRLGGEELGAYRLDTLRGAVALVMQESVLFSASLRENLTLARPDAAQADIEQAIRIASLESDIRQLPGGLDTEVGERGVTLSGGQRQRLCLARALLGDARILMLDDALSAVDAETEHRILEGLERHTRHLSRVVVSHRLSAVKDAEEILVLREGRVIERGTHQVLMRLGGWYAETWEFQQLASAIVEPAHA
jgi:ATP-binding cassette, subfamily B, multidrug efflux pump